jgi:hypothetical protein
LVIVQIIDDHAFQTPQEFDQWYKTIWKIVPELRKRIEKFHISFYASYEAQEFLKNLPWPSEVIFIENNEVFTNPLIPAEYSSIFNQYDQIHAHECCLSIFPMLLVELYQAELSKERFYEHICGSNLESITHLHAYFDQGVFRLSPRAIFYKSHTFHTQFALKKQKQWIEEHTDYLQMIARRSLSDSIQQLNASRSERLQWLYQHPKIPLLEKGFFSAGLGEGFWQDRVWNYNARYIIEPQKFDLQYAHTPFSSTLSFDQVVRIFPQSYHQIIELLVLYNDQEDVRLSNIPLKKSIESRIHAIEKQLSLDDAIQLKKILGYEYSYFI